MAPFSYHAAPETPEHNRSENPPATKMLQSSFRAESRFRPWRPVKLRRGFLLFFAVSCTALVASLQVLDTEVHRHQGIDASQEAVVNCLRYLPTVAAVFLGFIWRSLISDLKLMMPWSAMTDRIAPTSISLQANYVNAVDIFSMWTAARRRQWPLCFGLLGGLIAAVLVSFTNALTYVDATAKVSEDGVGFTGTSDFNLTSRFVDSNGSLTMAWNYTGSQPYAGVTSSQQRNGKYPPWTSDGYVFTTFATNQYPGQIINGTLSATATAFSAGLDCTPIRMSVVKPPVWSEEEVSNGVTTWWRAMQPNVDDLARARCDALPQINLTVVPGSVTNHYFLYRGSQTAWNMLSAGVGLPAAWFNLTKCRNSATESIRIWAHILRPRGGQPTASDLDVSSLLCDPWYAMQNASLSVNAGTGEVVSYALTDAAKPFHPGTITPDVLVTYLNNPLDGTSLDAYHRTSWQGSFAPNSQIVIPQASYINVTSWADYYFAVAGRDPFFAQMLSGYNASLTDALLNNSTKFAIATSSLVGNYVVQLANTMARESQNSTLKGTIVVRQPRVLVRDWARRAAQASLACLAVICVLLATLLRVRSCLNEDCGTLAAIAVHLANNPNVEQAMLRELDGLPVLSGFAWTRASRSDRGAVQIDLIPKETVEATSQTHLLADRYRPTTLHWLYITGVMIISLALIASAAETLREALYGLMISKGFNEWFAKNAFAFVPTIVLLLLGHGLGGLGDSVTRLEPYRNLRRGSGRPGRETVLFNPINHSVFSLPYRAVDGFGSLVLLFVSLLVVIYPGVKIAAAGIYKPSTSARLSQERTMSLDSSLVDNFESTYDLPHSVTGGITDRASQWSEWSRIKEFNLPPRIDALDKLVFTELQGDVGNAASVHAVIPAIEVNVTCQPYDNEDFSLWVSQTYNAYWGTLPCFMFRPETRHVDKTGAAMVDYYAMRMLQNSITASNYIGAAFLPVNRNTGTVLPGTPYTMLLADYSSVTSGIANETYVPVIQPRDQSKHNIIQDSAIEAKPGMFNVSLPTIRGVVCTREFNKVSVEATLMQGVRVGLNDSSTLLPWAVASYDDRTIKDRTPYDRSTPGWMFPYYPADSMSLRNFWNDAAAGGNVAEVVGKTLWPSKGTSRNVWEQLAVLQRSKVGHDSITSSLLDANELARSVEELLTAYSIQMLSELRPYTSQLANTTSKRGVNVNTIPVQVCGRIPTVQQSATITYVITAILATVIVWPLSAASPYLPFLGREREGLDLREPPGSIAAAMTLLAGSRLVQELRMQSVTRTDQTDIWVRKFRLGWWEEDTGSKKAEPGRRRWGIDVVE
ncbi:uncharacterized protein PV07_08766 [Cladophialophora immunda]|uniref:Uncharacterized protein n=1 Tax=Cladophialophora immunda TaxID=569365 RepID=A0A0D2C566_9EURO|nr:uncharacterized protein PV07_08766 [Cladophialophora immunda]KIW25600.1 hypothetical protein PV07_08766 [Cladophialophora immunda]